MAKKNGANKADKVKISRWFEYGLTVQQIARKLNMTIEAVNRFTPEKQKEVGKKTKAKNKKSKEDHTKIMDAKKSPAVHPDSPKTDSE